SRERRIAFSSGRSARWRRRLDAENVRLAESADVRPVLRGGRHCVRIHASSPFISGTRGIPSERVASMTTVRSDSKKTPLGIAKISANPDASLATRSDALGGGGVLSRCVIGGSG